jgi:DNA-directed RNA polymerase subunit RPC12/RpoP
MNGQMKTTTRCVRCGSVSQYAWSSGGGYRCYSCSKEYERQLAEATKFQRKAEEEAKRNGNN